MQTELYKNKSRLSHNKNSNISQNTQIRNDMQQILNELDHSDKIKIQILTRNKMSILSAPCGFGKSTLLILYLKQLYPGHQIVVTQPRRITVTQLTHRVKRLCNEKYQVKYAIQFDDQSHQVWDILYITEGLLVQKLIYDNAFIQNKIFVLDEAHEFSNNMILLLSIFKQIMSKLDNVKLLVCSATVDIELFRRYLKCQVLEIQNNKKYMVHYETSNILLDINSNMYLNVILNQIFRYIAQITQSNSNSSILIFLPGQHEIELLNNQICPYLEDGERLQGYKVVCLYASLNVSFIQTSDKSIYLATNIAETSITLPNISLVIDSGLQKKVVYNNLIKNYQLITMFISKSNMQQRSGRTGRTCNGSYIGVYHQSQLQDKQYIELENNSLYSFLMAYLSYFKTFKDIDLIINMKYQHLKRNILTLYKAGFIDKQGCILNLGTFYLQHRYIDDINYIKLLYASQNTAYYYQIVQLVSLLCAMRQNNRYINLNEYEQFINHKNDFKVLIDICCMLENKQNINVTSKTFNIHIDTLKYYDQFKNKIIGKQNILKQDSLFPTEMFTSVFKDTNTLINNNQQYYNDYTQQYVILSKYTQVSNFSSKILYFDGIFSTEKCTKVYYLLSSE